MVLFPGYSFVRQHIDVLILELQQCDDELKMQDYQIRLSVRRSTDCIGWAVPRRCNGFAFSATILIDAMSNAASTRFEENPNDGSFAKNESGVAVFDSVPL